MKTKSKEENINPLCQKCKRFCKQLTNIKIIRCYYTKERDKNGSE